MPKLKPIGLNDVTHVDFSAYVLVIGAAKVGKSTFIKHVRDAEKSVNVAVKEALRPSRGIFHYPLSTESKRRANIHLDEIRSTAHQSDLYHDGCFSSAGKFRAPNLIIVMFDFSNRDSFNDALSRCTKIHADREMRHIPLYLVGNKMDQPCDPTLYNTLDELLTNIALPIQGFVAISATEEMNIQKLMIQIGADLKQIYYENTRGSTLQSTVMQAATDSQFNVGWLGCCSDYLKREDYGKYKFLAKTYRALFQSDSPLSILEVGCGRGDFWCAFRDEFPLLTTSTITLTDVSREELKGCKAVTEIVLEGYNVQFQVLDLNAEGQNTQFPYQDNTFNIIIAHDVLYHAAYPVVTLRELHRILAPGGTLGVSTLEEGAMSDLYGLAHEIDVCLPRKSFTDHWSATSADRNLFDTFGEGNVRPTLFNGHRDYQDSQTLTSSFSHHPDILKANPTEAFRESFNGAIWERMKENGGSYRVNLRMTLFHCKKVEGGKVAEADQQPEHQATPE